MDNIMITLIPRARISLSNTSQSNIIDVYQTQNISVEYSICYVRSNHDRVLKNEILRVIITGNYLYLLSLIKFV